MDLSITLFGSAPAMYAEVAVQAEAVGVRSLWLSDHLVTPATFAATYPYDSTGIPGYDLTTPLNDVWVLAGYLSALTSRLTFGSGVFILPLRNPFTVALAVGTAQRLSAGRMLLGVGAGWMREEFDAVGEDFDTRGPRFDECLDVIDGLFAGGEFAYSGQHYAFPPLGLGGPPVGPVPTVFGGVTAAALRRTARRGDGWFGPVCPLADTMGTVRCIEALRAEAGTADRPFTYYPRVVGDLTLDTLRRYRDAGLDHVAVSGGQLYRGLDSAAARDDALARLAADATAAG